MRRQIKIKNSKVLEESLEYIPNGNNSKLRDLLFLEQKGFCAYTETYLGRTDQKDIDHFNPSKNFLDKNKYQNLFLCKALWNREKSDKWDKYQPILHPTSEDYEERVIYNKDLKIFEAKVETDFEAKNLVELLKLDDHDLMLERKRYLARIQEMSNIYGISIEKIFEKIISDNHYNHISFIRSIYEEFSVDIWNMIPEFPN